MQNLSQPSFFLTNSTPDASGLCHFLRAPKSNITLKWFFPSWNMWWNSSIPLFERHGMSKLNLMSDQRTFSQIQAMFRKDICLPTRQILGCIWIVQLFILEDLSNATSLEAIVHHHHWKTRMIFHWNNFFILLYIRMDDWWYNITLLELTCGSFSLNGDCSCWNISQTYSHP